MDFGEKAENLSKEKLLERIGDIRQIGNVKLVKREDGLAKDCRQAIFRTGRGLQFDVMVDRCLDISSLYYKGIPLVWRSPVSETHPSFYDARGDEWLRSFFGGLLTTCGLTHFGSSSSESDEGLHGRISNRPATNVSVFSDWNEEEYEMSVKGEMEQSKVFGENLALEREISTNLWGRKIRISDTVKNKGFRKTPHMLLYHINIGYPLLSKNSELLIDSKNVRGVDKRAKKEINEYDVFLDPQKDYEERVYEHQFKSSENECNSVIIFNPELKDGIGLEIKFNISQLPYLLEWKMMGQREYVLGLEPANSPMRDKTKLEENGDLPFLSPQESRNYNLEINILEDISNFK